MPASSPHAAREPFATLPCCGEQPSISQLEVTIEGQTPRRALVQADGSCRIGAHAANDVVIADPLVSQFHCKLHVVQGRWRLTDFGSLNGTRIDGVRVRDADVPMPDARIGVGESQVRVRLVDEIAAAETRADRFGALVGTEPCMRELFALLERVAQTDATVLVEGDSGTGKEGVATELVQRGRRADGPFVIVDCGAISPSLVEGELFGHARGAFTGADRDRVGAFEAASGGTLFLDEIGELPLALQPKLLRALESREIRRVGETHARKIDVRFIAATNRSLEVEVAHKRFREDLYYRLSTVTLRVPPLRERLGDIPLLVEHFLGQLGPPRGAELFTTRVLEELGRHDWPGNVRELRNHVEGSLVHRSATLRQSGMRARQSTSPLVADLDVPFKDAKDACVEAFERVYLSELIAWAGGNVSQAARRAGVDRVHLHRLLQRYSLSPARR